MTDKSSTKGRHPCPSPSTSFKQFNQVVTLTVFLACLLGGLAVAYTSPIRMHRLDRRPSSSACAIFLFAIKVIDQWEKVAVPALREVSRATRPGPGRHHPDSRHPQPLPVDQRVRVSTVSRSLHADARYGGPVCVDAIFYPAGLERREIDPFEVENFTCKPLR